MCYFVVKASQLASHWTEQLCGSRLQDRALRVLNLWIRVYVATGMIDLQVMITDEWKFTVVLEAFQLLDRPEIESSTLSGSSGISYSEHRRKPIRTHGMRFQV